MIATVTVIICAEHFAAQNLPVKRKYSIIRVPGSVPTRHSPQNVHSVTVYCLGLGTETQNPKTKNHTHKPNTNHRQPLPVGKTTPLPPAHLRFRRAHTPDPTHLFPRPRAPPGVLLGPHVSCSQQVMEGVRSTNLECKAVCTVIPRRLR